MRTGRPHYPTEDWQPRPSPTETSPELVVRRVRVTGSGGARTTVVEVDCGEPCKLWANATLRLRGSRAMARSKTATTASTGKAKLKLRLRLSRREVRRLAARRRLARIHLRIASVNYAGIRHVRTLTRRAH
jgi:uncharacterized protein with von Willebrand factor type A (vWA) domain